MIKLNFSTKRLLISKANTQIVAVTAGAAFIFVFSAIACRALLNQKSYQSRVIAAREVAKQHLITNLAAVDKLKAAYQEFISPAENKIGGSSTGTGEKDGNNAVLVLDALPPQYDFPGLVSSIEKVVTSRNLTIKSIGGTDDPNAQKDNAKSTQPVEIPFTLTVNSTYPAIKDLISALEKSIRPFNITSLSFSGTDNDLTLEIKAKTYYLPAKDLSITTEDVK